MANSLPLPPLSPALSSRKREPEEFGRTRDDVRLLELKIAAE
jgi:hypothetical protein